MKITKRQLRRIIKEAVFVSRVPKHHRLHEKYFGAETDDGVYEVSLTIDFDANAGDFVEKWAIRKDGSVVQEGDSFQTLQDLSYEDLGSDELYGAVSDVKSQVNDWV